MMGKKSIVVKNAISELEPLAAEVSGWCRQNGLIGDIDHELNLVLDEVVSNVIRHGYRDSEEHQILIILSLDQDEVTIQVEDDGVHFNPLMAPPADITKPINERSGGGLGIHLVREIMDGLEYRIVNGKNFLVMKKRRTG